KIKGKDVTFNVGEGTLTVRNSKSKNITLVDSNGSTISEDKYTKATKAANFVEEPNVGSGYWFAADDNFGTDNLANIVTQTTCSNSAIDMTDLAADYTSLNKINNKTFIAQANNK
ncbi:MAG: hypothetical protein IJ797_00140, partial [Selenomonadaceae bacterium]|nr:hypothetical protein [Selenomonadaceae bacterium]